MYLGLPAIITVFKEQTENLKLGCKTETGKFLSVPFPKSPDDVKEVC